MLQKLFVDGRGTLKLLKLLIPNRSTGKPFILDKPAFCSKNHGTSVMLFIFCAKQWLPKSYRLFISEAIYGDIYIYISKWVILFYVLFWRNFYLYHYVYSFLVYTLDSWCQLVCICYVKCNKIGHYAYFPVVMYNFKSNWEIWWKMKVLSNFSVILHNIYIKWRIWISYRLFIAIASKYV